MITHIIRRQFVLLCNTCACKLTVQLANESQVIGVHRKYQFEASKLHRRISASKPCATDVLRNWEISSKIIESRGCNKLRLKP